MKGAHSMRTLGKIAVVLLLATSVLSLATTDAHAYVDPGTGSFLFQMAAAGVLGAIFAIKVFWKNVKDAFARLFGRHPKG